MWTRNHLTYLRGKAKERFPRDRDDASFAPPEDRERRIGPVLAPCTSGDPQPR